MHYLFARTNDETNIKGSYFLSTSRYLGQLFSRYGNPCNIINKYIFFELPWDMNMQLVRDQIYYITPFGRYRI